MKITIETNDEIFTWKSKNHSDVSQLGDLGDAYTVSDVVNKFKGLLVSAGYHPDCVDKVIDTEEQWFHDRGRNELLLNE